MLNYRKCLFDAIVKPYDETDIIVKESQLKKIIVSHGEETIELESKGKIVNLQLSPDGKEIVYVTEKCNLMLYDIATETSYTILKLEKLNIFLKIINICNSNIIVCGWSNSNLMVRIKFLIQFKIFNYIFIFINFYSIDVATF